jgi:hypothetical protein
MEICGSNQAAKKLWDKLLKSNPNFLQEQLAEMAVRNVLVDQRVAEKAKNDPKPA